MDKQKICNGTDKIPSNNGILDSYGKSKEHHHHQKETDEKNRKTNV